VLLCSYAQAQHGKQLLACWHRLEQHLCRMKHHFKVGCTVVRKTMSQQVLLMLSKDVQQHRKIRMAVKPNANFSLVNTLDVAKCLAIIAKEMHACAHKKKKHHLMDPRENGDMPWEELSSEDEGQEDEWGDLNVVDNGPLMDDFDDEEVVGSSGMARSGMGRSGGGDVLSGRTGGAHRHFNKCYTLTGCEKLNGNAIAKIINEALGDPRARIQFESTSPRQMKCILKKQVHTSEIIREIIMELWCLANAQKLNFVTSDVQKIAGSKAQPMREFIRNNIDSFKP